MIAALFVTAGFAVADVANAGAAYCVQTVAGNGDITYFFGVQTGPYTARTVEWHPSRCVSVLVWESTLYQNLPWAVTWDYGRPMGPAIWVQQPEWKVP